MANARMGEMVISVDPADELVAIGLGSCIGLAIVDAKAGVAGLAHIVLPDSGGDDGPPAKFADTAVPELIARVCEAGARRSRLRTAIVGGARMFAATQQLDIGARNCAAVRTALGRAQLTCHAHDTGGGQGRTLRVTVATGKVTSRAAGQDPIELLTPLRSRVAGKAG